MMKKSNQLAVMVIALENLKTKNLIDLREIFNEASEEVSRSGIYYVFSTAKSYQRKLQVQIDYITELESLLEANKILQKQALEEEIIPATDVTEEG